jgi:hypothetical protein
MNAVWADSRTDCQLTSYSIPDYDDKECVLLRNSDESLAKFSRIFPKTLIFLCLSLREWPF